MADKKISALTSASTPLAGTEVLPIVQGGATVKVAVSDLTAGRIADLKSFNLTDTSNPYGQWIWTNGTARSYYLEGSGNLARLYSGNLSVVVQQWDITTGATRINYPLTVADNVVISTSGKGIDFSATPGTGTSELFADYEEGTFTPTDNSGAGLSLTQTGQATYVKSGTQVTCTMDVTYPATANTSYASIAFPFATATSSSFVGQIGYQTVGSYLSPSGDNAGFVFWDIAGSPQTNANLSGKRLQITFTYRSAT